MAAPVFVAEPDTRTAAEEASAVARDMIVSAWCRGAVSHIADPQERADHSTFMSLLRTHTFESSRYVNTATVYCYPWPKAAASGAAADGAGAAAGPPGGPAPAAASAASAASASATQWACVKCTLLNAVARSKCSACSAARPQTPSASAPPLPAGAPVASLTVRAALDGSAASSYRYRSGGTATGNAMVTVRMNGFTGVLTDAVFSPGAFESMYAAMGVPASVSTQFRVMHILNSVAAFAKSSAGADTGHAGDRYEFLRDCVPHVWLDDSAASDELSYDVWKRFQYLTATTDQSLKDWPTDCIGLVRDYLCPPLKAGNQHAADVWFKRPGTRVGYQNDTERTHNP